MLHVRQAEHRQTDRQYAILSLVSTQNFYQTMNGPVETACVTKMTCLSVPLYGLCMRLELLSVFESAWFPVSFWRENRCAKFDIRLWSSRWRDGQQHEQQNVIIILWTNKNAPSKILGGGGSIKKWWQGDQLEHTCKPYTDGQLTGCIPVSMKWCTRHGRKDNLQFLVWLVHRTFARQLHILKISLMYMWIESCNPMVFAHLSGQTFADMYTSFLDCISVKTVTQYLYKICPHDNMHLLFIYAWCGQINPDSMTRPLTLIMYDC